MFPPLGLLGCPSTTLQCSSPTGRRVWVRARQRPPSQPAPVLYPPSCLAQAGTKADKTLSGKVTFFSSGFNLKPLSAQVFLDGNVPTGEDPLANHHAISEVDPGAEAGLANGRAVAPGPASPSELVGPVLPGGPGVLPGGHGVLPGGPGVLPGGGAYRGVATPVTVPPPPPLYAVRVVTELGFPIMIMIIQILLCL